MRYCVVWQDGWRVALLHGLLKQPEPGVYRTVREACAESDRRNMALEVTSANVRPGTDVGVSAA